MPIYEGYPLMNSLITINCGGKRLNEKLKGILAESNNIVDV
jgi:actin-related protein